VVPPLPLPLPPLDDSPLEELLEMLLNIPKSGLLLTGACSSDMRLFLDKPSGTGGAAG
jgi:hypothetical protein